MFIVYIVGVILVGFAGFRAWRFAASARVAGRSMLSTSPYVRQLKNPKSRILFVGDSTAVGVGVTDASKSVAGRFASYFPKSSIENIAVSGARLADLNLVFKNTTIGHYDLLMVHIGANDIIHLTKLKTARKQLRRAVVQAKKHSGTVVILHGGNIGGVPVFPLPLRWFYSHRTRQFRKLYSRIASQEKIIYVDMFTNLKTFPHYQNGVSTYATDSFHPSDEGYRIWFDVIIRTIKSTNKDLVNRLR